MATENCTFWQLKTAHFGRGHLDPSGRSPGDVPGDSWPERPGKLQCWRPLGGSLTLPFRGGAQPMLEFSHPVAVPADVHDVAVVQQEADERGRHHLVVLEDSLSLPEREGPAGPSDAPCVLAGPQGLLPDDRNQLHVVGA